MIKLMELPYNLDALEPYISRQTLGFHYLKHHKGYVEKLNKLIEGTQFETMTLEEIVTEAHKKMEYQDIYHNAAQVWNHNFYWQSLNPNGGEPNKKLLEKIEETFGSFDDFKDIMRKKALEQFGSGWAWLAEDNNGNLLAYNTSNADNPLIFGHTPLLTIDVWEHAYYLDCQNLRADYVNKVLDNLLNWQNLKAFE
ncbi:MAG: superoxide dismutase [Alphaproteobacteria bacterium]|nr:superoxide dismutase [Alphaproteobacteria bacterium]